MNLNTLFAKAPVEVALREHAPLESTLLVARTNAPLSPPAPCAHAAARPNQVLSEDQIAEILRALGDIRAVIHAADPADKARIYKGLGLR